MWELEEIQNNQQKNSGALKGSKECRKNQIQSYRSRENGGQVVSIHLTSPLTPLLLPKLVGRDEENRKPTWLGKETLKFFVEN